jgi:hypothetical protein
MQATFAHIWRQRYTSTWFSISEIGANSRRQVRDFSITLSATGKVFDPTFGASMSTASASHSTSECANPIYCAQACWSRCGTGWEFGYSPTLSESVYAVSIDGFSCGINGGNQTLTLP